MSAASGKAAAPASKESAGESGEKKPEAARIYQGTGQMFKLAQPEKPSTEPANISLNFEAADIREIAKTVLADILGESYIVDPKVQGSVSFRTTRPLPRSALLPTLETVLRLNGVVMVKENGIFKLLPANTVRGSVSPSTGNVFAGYAVQVVPLMYVGAREMAKILEPFAPDANAVKTDELRNLLILSGTQNEIRHMLDTIEIFDVDWLSGMSVGLFTLQSADVKTVDAELNKIMGDKNLNPLAGVVRFIPIERLNGFVIITPQPHYLDQAKLWLERLDRAGGTAGGVRLFVYHVQNGKAEHMAELLNQTFGGGRAAAARTPAAPSIAPGLAPTNIMSSTPSGLGTTTAGTAIGAAAQRQGATAGATGATLSVTDETGTSASEVRIVADKENNALLILTTTAGYEKIETALRKLDVAPRQVLIEVMIAEVTLTDELQWGVEWLFTNGARKFGQFNAGSSGPTQTTGTGWFSYALASASGSGLKAVLNMLATGNKLRVLSSPHIMVSDNQTAKIQVGDSVPIPGPQTVSNSGTTITSAQYLDTGVIISVTPRINAGGLVNLDINQESSVPGATNAALNNAPTVSKRSTKTQVTVQSGETMVLGGLISEQSTNTSSGLPVLSAIPVLGGLFGNTDRQTTKTELIVMITPHVAANFGQAKQISEEVQRKMGEVKDLMDCGTANLFGYTSRGGLFCLQPGRFEGKIDRMNETGPDGAPAYPPPAPPAPKAEAQPAQAQPAQAQPAQEAPKKP